MNFEINSLANLKCPMTELSDRAAMGLPEGYVAFRAERLCAEMADVRTLSVERLLEIIADARSPFARRLAAGSMLAQIGDPRISVFSPPMCRLPAAKVALGLDPSQLDGLCAQYSQYGVLREWLEKECPRFETEISAFAIGKYAITNSEYLAFLNENPKAELPSSWGPFGRFPAEISNHPVFTISAESADAYVVWLSAKTGRKFRLPSEFEWEYAAAGLEGHEFPWGPEFKPDHANTVEGGLVCSTPVGIYPAGAAACRALDMAGNVEEFTSNNYSPYPGARAINDDLSTTRGIYRIARGGSFARFSDLARCKRRHGHFPRAIYAMGFRLAEDF